MKQPSLVLSCVFPDPPGHLYLAKGGFGLGYSNPRNGKEHALGDVLREQRSDRHIPGGWNRSAALPTDSATVIGER